MPRSIAAKAAFYDHLVHFIHSQGGARGFSTSAICQRFLPETPVHVTTHALRQLKKEGRLTRWREGRQDVWVSTLAQDRAEQEAQTSVPAPVFADMPDLKIGMVRSTGTLRIVWKGLKIEIGVIEE